MTKEDEFEKAIGSRQRETGYTAEQRTMLSFVSSLYRTIKPKLKAQILKEELDLIGQISPAEQALIKDARGMKSITLIETETFEKLRQRNPLSELSDEKLNLVLLGLKLAKTDVTTATFSDGSSVTNFYEEVKQEQKRRG